MLQGTSVPAARHPNQVHLSARSRRTVKSCRACTSPAAPPLSGQAIVLFPPPTVEGGSSSSARLHSPSLAQSLSGRGQLAQVRKSRTLTITAASNNGNTPTAQTPQPEAQAQNDAETPLEDMTATTARAKLELLAQLKRRSNEAMKSTEGSEAPRMIDARMYASAVASQRKISEKLSQANQYIDVLQDKLKEYDDDLEAAADIFKKVSMEFGTMARLSDSAVAAVKFGVDKQDAVQKITKLKERLDALEKAMKKEREQFSRRVPRKVPVTWVGNADQVKLVGSFDEWSRGVELSMPDVEGDSVLRTFEATLNLLPGRYLVKFMVDGEWRLAPEWPMEKDAKGETNNVLEVK